MKKIFTLFIFTLLSFTIVAQTLPNNGFEEWVSNPLPAYEEPVQWNTPNPLTSLAGAVTVEKSDDAYAGEFSAKLITKTIIEGVNSPGLITYADFSVDFATAEYEISGGLFMKEKVFSLSGQYKYKGEGGDSATVFIYSFANPEDGDFDTIGIGYRFLHDAAEWTPFTVNMIALNDHAPDTFNVMITSAGTFSIEDMPAGSTLNVDDLTIETNVGIFDATVGHIDMSVFPNPAVDRVTFETSDMAKERKLLVYDISGRIVRDLEFNNRSLVVETGDLPSGNYSYRVMSKNKLFNSGSFIKK